MFRPLALASIFCFSLIQAADSLEQRIGELFIVSIVPQEDEEYQHKFLDAMKKHYIGGVLIQKGSVEQTKDKLSALRSHIPERPILVCMDAEWGTGMRITDGTSFPRNLALGAIKSKAILRRMGRYVGYEMKQHFGAHVNFAPVIDVNVNPKNPIIGTRSFGSDPSNVIEGGTQVMLGLQDAGVAACAKHFPGHGDVAVDSHYALPTLQMSVDELYNVHLKPFKELHERGLSCIMTAHVAHQDLFPNVPCTLSPKLKRLLSDIGYNGIMITDALNMGAVLQQGKAGEIAVKALKSGNHLLLYGSHILDANIEILTKQIPKAIKAIKKAVQNGELDIDPIVKKVRAWKKQVFAVKELEKEPEDPHTLRNLLYRRAITTLGDVPDWQKNHTLNYKAFGEDYQLQEELSHYFQLDEEAEDTVIALNLSGPRQEKYGITDEMLTAISTAKETGGRVCLLLCGTPYALEFLNTEGIYVLVGYENAQPVYRAMKHILTGLYTPDGVLPIELSQ